MRKIFYVYILCSKKNGTLYVGVTSDLRKRTRQHKSGLIEGFTSKYAVNKLVYFEVFSDPLMAISREKNLKTWRRAWKIALIEKSNPGWEDIGSEE